MAGCGRQTASAPALVLLPCSFSFFSFLSLSSFFFLLPPPLSPKTQNCRPPAPPGSAPALLPPAQQPAGGRRGKKESLSGVEGTAATPAYFSAPPPRWRAPAHPAKPERLPAVGRGVDQPGGRVGRRQRLGGGALACTGTAQLQQRVVPKGEERAVLRQRQRVVKAAGYLCASGGGCGDRGGREGMGLTCMSAAWACTSQHGSSKSTCCGHCCGPTCHSTCSPVVCAGPAAAPRAAAPSSSAPPAGPPPRPRLRQQGRRGG